jgi:NADPH-dependent glutamate synthase beta subunit-like oxidoreductase
MDVCPVQALDMRRPTARGVEGDAADVGLMETPIQVGECIGCTICQRECPVHVITIASAAHGQPVLADRQGPIAAPPPDRGWVPLTAITREALKHDHPSPYASFAGWRTGTGHRPTDWTTGTPAVAATSAPAPTDGMAPCQVACPAGTDAGRYVGLISAGRYDEAYQVAAEVNPFPSVCGWICTAPCEAACRRGTLDEPVAIRTLKRFAVEHGTLPAVAAGPRRSERVAVVGGGPAGMSAAYYLARLGYPVVVFEAMPVPGGMMAIGIPEYRLPREVLAKEIDRIVGLGVELRLNQAMGRDFTLLDLERDGFAAVFLATGASRSRRLGVPGDDVEGVVPATLFLKRVNLGEHPRLDGPVVVVGGGSTAMDAGRSALRSGAASVTVLYRRGRSDMPAQPEEVEAAEREGIAIRTATGIAEVVAHDGRVVEVRVVERRRTDPADGSGTWADVPGSMSMIPASTLLIAVGEEPDPSILPEGAGVGVSASAAIVADPRSLATGRTGVFAGGDVVSGAKSVIDAVAAGRRAAGSIHAFLAGVPDGEAAVMAAARVPRSPQPALRLDIGVRPRAHAPAPAYVPGSFTADQVGFTDEAARSEAMRCFRCDVVDGCPVVTVLSGRGPGRANGEAPVAEAVSAASATASVSSGSSTASGPFVSASVASAPRPASSGWLTAVPVTPSATLNSGTGRGGQR